MTLMLVALIDVAAAADWTDLPWMTAEPGALLGAARAASPAGDDDTRLLLDETDVHIDAAGRRVRRTRYVFVILTPKGAEEWGVFGESWADWYQDKPQIDARVVTPDGAIHPLDKAHIAESVDPGADPLLLSDVRVLRAPLPSLVPGAVVEEIITVREHEPFVAEGGVTFVPLAVSGMVERTRIRIEAPDGTPFNWRIEGSDVKAAEAHSKGAHTLTIDLGPRSFESYFEDGVPSDVQQPALYVSTAKSWTTLASSYSAIVDKALSTSNLAERAAASRGSATGRDAIVAALLAEARKPRYIGIEFGRSAIVPSTPDDVIRHGYGDCKDKATLLVGLLRASGIPAEVALLQTGPGSDIGPVPGLDEFNHAIVHIGGANELWVDPTTDWTKVGDLPLGDQGRRALIAAPSTKGPVLTPTLPSSTNTAHIVRDFTLPARGYGRLVETTTTSGWLDQNSRGAFTRADKKTITGYFEDRASTQYWAPAIDPPVLTDPRDLAVPFTTTLTMPKANVAETLDTDAAARFGRLMAFDWLPDWVTTARDPKEDPRRNPLQLARHAVLIEQKVRPPAAYVMAALPEPVSEQVGPVSWSIKYRAEADGLTVATLQFDTGDGRLTPEQVETLRAKLGALKDSDAIFLRWDHSGEVAFRDGRVGEALQTYQRLSTQSPKDAIFADQWARALLRVGFGGAARKQATLATQLAPNDAEVQSGLGFVLLHDTRGALAADGLDRAGARAALRKAIELDPKQPQYYVWLATAEERNDAGVFMGPGSDIGAAAKALRERLEKTESHDLDDTLAGYYASAKRWDDLTAFLPVMTQSPTRSAMQILLAVVNGNVEAGVALAARMPGSADDRRVALGGAAQQLMFQRRYAESAKLMEASAAGAPNAVALRANARLVASVGPYENIPFAKDDPAAIPARLIVASMLGRKEDIISLLSKDLLSAAKGKDDEGSAVAAFTDGFASAAEVSSTIPQAVIVDLAVANLETRVEGDADTGWRVTESLKNGGMTPVSVYVVKEKGVCRFRAAGALTELGTEALRRATRNDLAGARQWLTWAREDAPKSVNADPFLGSPFAHTWTGASTTDKHDLRVAGAMLMVDAAYPEAIDALLAERPAAKTPAETLQIDRALVLAYVTAGRWEDASKVLDQLRTDHPESIDTLGGWALTMSRLGRAREARPAVEAAAAAKPGNLELLRLLARVSSAEHDLPGTLAAYQRIVDTGKGEAGDYNGVAWYGLADPARALAASQQSNAMGGYKEEGYMHTLALALIGAGKPDEAREVLVQASAAAKGSSLEGWQYVRGRLAEAWGLPRIAADLYAEIPAPAADEEPAPWSIRSMAAERRRALP